MQRMLRFAALLLALALALPAGNVSNGSNTCPTSGAKRISSTSIRAIHFTVQSVSSNMGIIYLGGPSVTTNGVAIGAGDADTFPPASNTAQYDLSQIYFACSVNTDSIVYTYLQ